MYDNAERILTKKPVVIAAVNMIQLGLCPCANTRKCRTRTCTQRQHNNAADAAAAVIPAAALPVAVAAAAAAIVAVVAASARSFGNAEIQNELSPQCTKQQQQLGHRRKQKQQLGHQRKQQQQQERDGLQQ